GLTPLERGQNGVRFPLVADDGLLAIEQMELRGELLAVLLEERFDGPVFDRLESADLALALDEQPQRHGLHATGGYPFLYGLPEDGTRLVSHESVEDATRLLRVNFSLVDLAGILDRSLNSVASDLVKENPSHRRAVLRLDL